MRILASGVMRLVGIVVVLGFFEFGSQSYQEISQKVTVVTPW